MNMILKEITRAEAEKLGMTIWRGNENWYARLPIGINRENALYGYVFTIIQ
jgi:hypothetical protein